MNRFKEGALILIALIVFGGIMYIFIFGTDIDVSAQTEVFTVEIENIDQPVQIEYNSNEVEENKNYPTKCEIVIKGDIFISPVLRIFGNIPKSLNLETFVGVYRSEWAQTVKGYERATILSLDSIVEKNNPPTIYPGDWLCVSNNWHNLEKVDPVSTANN